MVVNKGCMFHVKAVPAAVFPGITADVCCVCHIRWGRIDMTGMVWPEQGNFNDITKSDCIKLQSCIVCCKV